MEAGANHLLLNPVYNYMEHLEVIAEEGRAQDLVWPTRHRHSGESRNPEVWGATVRAEGNRSMNGRRGGKPTEGYLGVTHPTPRHSCEGRNPEVRGAGIPSMRLFELAAAVVPAKVGTPS